MNFEVFISCAVTGAGDTVGKHPDMPVTPGQSPHAFETEITKTVRTDYLLYLPTDYETAQAPWPLLLFLHGAGERGNDLNQLKKHGPPKRVEKGDRSLPFVVVSPQCPKVGWWSSETQVDTLDALLESIVSDYRIDADRIYVTGLSMGGYGTWRLAAAYPDRFAAIAPICGGGNPDDAEHIAHLPTWVFHGAKDDVVPIKKSEEMVDALKAAGSDVEFTVYPDAGHNCWGKPYAGSELYDWFLTHTRGGNES